MEFRAPSAAAQQNAEAVEFFTNKLKSKDDSRHRIESLIEELGNCVEGYPDWHPILTAPQKKSARVYNQLSSIKAYNGVDHTRMFVRGFITCPYDKKDADSIVENVKEIPELSAYILDVPLYSDNAFAVIVEAVDVEFEADGTIHSRDALTWFVENTISHARHAQCAETWWNIRKNILGRPCGSRSSLFVNQNCGVHMKKILESLNNSGIFGKIVEDSLEMLSKRKRQSICENLINAAISNWDKNSSQFIFRMRDEDCLVKIRDIWEDGSEYSIDISIGEFDLYVTGIYYSVRRDVTFSEPRGKRAVAEKFV